MRDFHQIDVFSNELSLGNALAVVHDADGLTDAAMAAFATWTNLSETTFLLSPDHAEADYRVRIFTPSQELPFAGHPTLGSARAWLEAGGQSQTPGLVIQECGAGLVRIRQDGSRLAFAAPPLLRGGEVDPADVNRISTSLGLRPDQVIAAQWADNGPGWVALLLDSAQSVLEVDLRPGALRPDDNVGIIGPHPPQSDVDFEVRAFMSRGREDPVTGSLNAALGQWLVGAGIASGSYKVAQGTRLGRRGRLFVDQVDGQVWVGGDTVVGVSGTVAL